MISPELARYAALPTIPVRYAAEMLQRAGISGDRMRAILIDASLPEEMLEIAQLRLSAAQFARLYDLVRRAAGDELFGYFRRPVPPGAYATVLGLLARCPTAKDALDATKSFYRLFDPHDYWSIEHGDPIQVTLHVADDGQAASIFFVHTMLLSLWRTVLWLCNQRSPLRAMRLDRRFSSLVGETRFLFGVEPELTNGENAILFDHHLVDQPVIRRPVDVAEYAKTSLIEMIGGAPEGTLEAEIRALLSADRPIASSSLEEVAAALGLSRQTLSRRLQERGSSFQALKDELRRDHAIALLADGRHPAAEIAELLGYSEPSAFSRAFRAWTGLSPARYRRS